MAKKERDYYEILGVPHDADQKTIKDAYHRLAMKWHPDRSKEPDTEERFKEIAKAYAILSDSSKRTRYDARGFEGVAHYSEDDLYGDIDLGSLFGDLGFGFGPGGDSIFDRIYGHPNRGPTRGDDLRINLQIPLERIAEGGSESFSFNRPDQCSRCNGYGTSDGKAPSACPACDGSGHQILRSQQKQENNRSVQFQQLITCPTCNGRGIQLTNKCTSCEGRGQIEKPETLKIQIPKGIEEGITLRIPDHGMPGSTTASKPGHLLISIYSAPDPRFQRRGADLWRSEALQLDEAVLGIKRTVPTLNGDVEVTIPPGVQPDEVLRLRGKGLPRYQSNQYGDLNLRLQIHIPGKLSKKEKSLFQQLRDLRTRS